MTKTLQEALIQSGLMDKEADSHDPFARFPKNRLGRPVTWAKWIVRSYVPKNAEGRCVLCGWIPKPHQTDRLHENDAVALHVSHELRRRSRAIPFRVLHVCRKCR